MSQFGADIFDREPTPVPPKQTQPLPAIDRVEEDSLSLPSRVHEPSEVTFRPARRAAEAETRARGPGRRPVTEETAPARAPMPAHPMPAQPATGQPVTAQPATGQPLRGAPHAGPAHPPREARGRGPE